jgi:uncharacterized protein
VTFCTTEYGFILSLDPGDEVINCLIRFARQRDIDHASIAGAGALGEVELGSPPGSTSGQRRLLNGPLEARSLTGTLTLLDGQPFPHLRGAFVRPDGSVAGGHVYQAVCREGLELAIHAPPAATAAPRGARPGHPFNTRDAK